MLIQIVKLVLILSSDILFSEGNHRHHSSKIVSGDKTTIEKHPFQVAVITSDSVLCGGIIILEWYVLTAAHCIQFVKDPHEVTVRAGSTFLSKDFTLRDIRKLIMHPLYQYNGNKEDFDAALLKLKNSLTMSTKIKPINLVAENAKYTSDIRLTVTGWGCLEEACTMPDELHKVVIPIAKPEVCDQVFPGRLTDRMFCAGYYKLGGEDACFGDSGGPAERNGVQYGIVSWGEGCGRVNYLGVYVKVSRIRYWITDVTGI